MPVSMKHEQTKFRWKLQDGAPVAPVFKIGDDFWMQCPLCGCIHDTRSQTAGEFKPRCLPREWNTPNYKKWIEKYPDAPGHKTVLLVKRRESKIRPLPTIEKAKAA